LLATVLFAAAPWAVIHARKIWAQDLLPPFVILWAWTGWLAFIQRRPRALIAHALALAACIHLHYSALWLIPVTLAWAIAFARRIQWKPALIAAAVFAATFAPFVIADAARGGPNLSRIVDIVRQPAAIDDQALRLAWLMVTGQEIHSLAGPQEFQNYLASVPGGEAGFGLTTVVGLLVAAGVVVALVDVIRATRQRSFDARSAAAFMLLTWLVLPVLLQSRHSLPIFPHYFIILFPAPFVLIGLLFGRLLALGRATTTHQAISAQRRLAAVETASTDTRSRPASAGAESAQADLALALPRLPVAGKLARQVGPWALITFSVFVAVLQSVQSLALQSFVAARSTPGGYGVPVEMTLRIADEALKARTDLGGAEILIYADGDNPLAHEGPAVLDVLLPPDAPRRFVDLAQAARVYPRDAAIVVWYSPQGQPLPAALADRSPLFRPESTIALRAGEGKAEVRAWPGQRGDVRYATCDTPMGHWQNGVTLLAVRPSGEWRGSGGWIEVCYRVAAEQVADVHWFNHVIGSDGQRWAQIDGAGYPSRYWRAGDVIEVRFGPFGLPAEAPAGRYALRVGMYTYPDIVNVPLIDAASQPAGDSLKIDLGDTIH
jgi:hypothetical protein